MTTTYQIDAKGRPVIDKDPNASLDYTFNWAEWLSPLSDTISGAVITIDPDSGLELVTAIQTATQVTVWVSGGTPKSTGSVACKITTSSTPPRIDERTIYIKLKDK